MSQQAGELHTNVNEDTTLVEDRVPAGSRHPQPDPSAAPTVLEHDHPSRGRNTNEADDLRAPQDRLFDALATMKSDDGRVIVIDEHGQLVGLVTPSDVTAAFDGGVIGRRSDPWKSSPS